MQSSWLRLLTLATTGSLLIGSACVPGTVIRDPFLTYSEEYGVAGRQATTEGGQPAGTEVEEFFRLPTTLTFINNHTEAVLETSFVAWVELGSIRSAGQQDALLRGGFKQLTSEVRLGTAYTLPVGTFVYGGPGMAGATPVRLAPAQTGEQAAPTSVAFDLITPDCILVFVQPPVSCESAAFTFSDPATGQVLSGSSAAGGGYKTLAQVDVYECSPLRPGLFFSAAGGVLRPNEFREGDPITFTFNAGSTADGAFAVVTIGAS